MAIVNHKQISGKPVVLGEISRATGISVEHLSRILGGHRLPSFDKAAKIASYVGVSLDDFYAEISHIRATKG